MLVKEAPGVIKASIWAQHCVIILDVLLICMDIDMSYTYQCAKL